jgi:hypothetical protein
VSIALVLPSSVLQLFSERSSQIHIGTALASGAVWLATRRGKPSIALLSALDYVVGVGLPLDARGGRRLVGEASRQDRRTPPDRAGPRQRDHGGRARRSRDPLAGGALIGRSAPGGFEVEARRTSWRRRTKPRLTSSCAASKGPA